MNLGNIKTEIFYNRDERNNIGTYGLYKLVFTFLCSRNRLICNLNRLLLEIFTVAAAVIIVIHATTKDKG
jgi:hypothetical protein